VSTGTDPQADQKIGETINEITERATLIIREELELARTEVEVKMKNLARGAAIAGAAGFFVMMGMTLFLHGLAWVFYQNVFHGAGDIFWGFLIVAGSLFLLGGLAGWLAARLFKAGAPPTPQMAIDEAKLIRETVEDSAKGPDA
jgi:hypothetical protein